MGETVVRDDIRKLTKPFVASNMYNGGCSTSFNKQEIYLTAFVIVVQVQKTRRHEDVRDFCGAMFGDQITRRRFVSSSLGLAQQRSLSRNARLSRGVTPNRT
eukprot:gb/GEZJ01004713.1/.p1 GENE.gb/GEZJ01004713.1/~~gb/GEZJ01004713.1/.p1  ORF type:complete len:102 (-),score=7.25 gb/GEZJ01004713.1/:437-742(-)